MITITIREKRTEYSVLFSTIYQLSFCNNVYILRLLPYGHCALGQGIIFSVGGKLFFPGFCLSLLLHFGICTEFLDKIGFMLTGISADIAYHRQY